MSEIDEILLNHEKHYTRKAIEYHIPDYMVKGLVDYIVYGKSPGGFLNALLRGDLFLVFAIADSNNKNAIENYVRFLHNVPPSICYGNDEKIIKWIETGGMRGVLKPEGSASSSQSD
ncbi:MAG: hypothetical protein ACOC44_16465 [Promethearchaeia archaeon]